MMTDEKLDKKKVAEARWEEMKYVEVMGVCKKVAYAQAIKRTGRRPIGIRWADVKKADGHHRSSRDAPSEALKPLTVKLAARERERRDTKIASGDNNSFVMIHVCVHIAFFCSQAKPNTDLFFSE